MEDTLFGYFMTGIVPVKKNNSGIQYSATVSPTTHETLPVPIYSDELLFSEDHNLKHELEILWDK